MNFNTVVSLPAAADLRGKEHVSLKLSATGVDIAGASDVVIGTLLRGAEAGRAVDVFLTKGNGLHYVQVGSAEAIAVADALKQTASGTFSKKLPADTGVATAGYAVEAAPAGSNGGGMIRAIIL
jgi:hypothetical protein